MKCICATGAGLPSEADDSQQVSKGSQAKQHQGSDAATSTSSGINPSLLASHAPGTQANKASQDEQEQSRASGTSGATARGIASYVPGTHDHRASYSQHTEAGTADKQGLDSNSGGGPARSVQGSQADRASQLEQDDEAPAHQQGHSSSPEAGQSTIAHGISQGSSATANAVTHAPGTEASRASGTEQGQAPASQAVMQGRSGSPGAAADDGHTRQSNAEKDQSAGLFEGSQSSEAATGSTAAGDAAASRASQAEGGHSPAAQAGRGAKAEFAGHGSDRPTHRQTVSEQNQGRNIHTGSSTAGGDTQGSETTKESQTAYQGGEHRSNVLTGLLHLAILLAQSIASINAPHQHAVMIVMTVDISHAQRHLHSLFCDVTSELLVWFLWSYAPCGDEDRLVTLLWLHVQGNLQMPQRPNQPALSRQHSMVMLAQMPSLRLSNRLGVMTTLTEVHLST